jgi:hypothetical protein
MLFESRRCDLTSVNVTRLDLWFMMVRQAGEATKSGAKLIGKSATVLSESPRRKNAWEQDQSQSCAV